MPVGGTEMPSTSSVIATAITPSEKDSSRLVPMGVGSPGGRGILSGAAASDRLLTAL